MSPICVSITTTIAIIMTTVTIYLLLDALVTIT